MGNQLKADNVQSVLSQWFTEGVSSTAGSATGWMPRSASSCCGWRFRSNLRSRNRKWYKHIWKYVHESHANIKSQDDTKVHVLVHRVPEYVRRTGVQLGPTSEPALASQHKFFDIVYHWFRVNRTNSPFLENVYWILYHIITRVICKEQIDILYSVFRILSSSDSWAWISRQEDFESAQYSPPYGLMCTTCLVHTNSHPRFFCEMPMK